MRNRSERGYTLVELMVASGLLVVLVVIAVDLLPDIFTSRNTEFLNDRVNRESRRVLERLQNDIASAGFRFAPPIIPNDGDGNTLLALESPAKNHLRMRCVVGTCQLSEAAERLDTALILRGFENPGANLIYTYGGNTEYLIVTAVDPIGGAGESRASLKYPLGAALNPLTPPLPAGTALAEIATIEYQIVGGELIRRFNGIVQSRTPIDPEGTSITYVLNDDGGIKEVDLLSAGDLANLLHVNISLQLTRAGSTSRGKSISVTDTATQRITPLNLNTF